MRVQAAPQPVFTRRELPQLSTPVPALPQEPSPPPQDPALARIDTLKRRSTLINMLDPVGMTLGLVCTPRDTLGQLGGIGSALIHGQTDAARAGIEVLVYRGVNPVAPFSYLYRGGQWLGAAIDGTIGGLEVSHGLKTGNKAMVAMGVADFVGGTSSAAVAAGFPGVSLGMTVASAALKTGLVLVKPGQFTRIQRMKTFFDAGFAISTSMLRAGIGVIPALCVQSVLGGFEFVYMNHTRFREKTDAVLAQLGSWGPFKPS